MDAPKIISLLHLVISVFAIGSRCLLRPMEFFLDSVGVVYVEASSETIQQAMAHTSFLYGGIYMILSVLMVVLCLGGERQKKVAMSLLVSIWLYVALALKLHPWPDEGGSNIQLGNGVTLPGITPIIVLWTTLGAVGFFLTPKRKARGSEKKRD